jgi:hypothetical protein
MLGWSSSPKMIAVPNKIETLKSICHTGVITPYAIDEALDIIHF